MPRRKISRTSAVLEKPLGNPHPFQSEIDAAVGEEVNVAPCSFYVERLVRMNLVVAIKEGHHSSLKKKGRS